MSDAGRQDGARDVDNRVREGDMIRKLASPVTPSVDVTPMSIGESVATSAPIARDWSEDDTRTKKEIQDDREAMWGSGHDQSMAVTYESARMLGIPGYQHVVLTHEEERDAKLVARAFLARIARSKPHTHTFFSGHVMSPSRLAKFRVGVPVRLPLVALTDTKGGARTFGNTAATPPNESVILRFGPGLKTFRYDDVEWITAGDFVVESVNPTEDPYWKTPMVEIALAPFENARVRSHAQAPSREESFDDEIARLDKAHADRIAQVFAAWAQSSAMVVTELGGGEELALLSPEMSTPQEGPMRLTYLMHDGPRGHDVGTRAQLAERLAQTLFLQVRPASEAEVMAWTTTPTYVRGAEIVALVQAENEFRQLASRMDRYQEAEAVLQQAHVLSHTDVEAATTLLQQTMARWQEGSGFTRAPSRAQAGTNTYRPLIEQPFDVGEVVYHGTASSEDFTVLDGPAWITDDMAVASMYLEDGEGDRRILTYRIKKSPKLAVTDGHGDSWREFVAWANDGGAGDPERGVCDKGLDGYVVDRRSNTMICRPEEFLEFVRVTRMRPHAQAPIARARGVARAGRRDIPPEIQAVMPDLVRVAQREYDDWQQDAEGYDEEVGSGGICHLIADKMAGVLSDKNVMCTTVSSSHEVHVYVVVQLPSGVWNVDIRPHVYERGGGYTWKKIPDVSFEEADIDVDRLSPFPEDFGEYVDAEAPQRRVARAPESGLFAPFSQPEDQHALTLFLHHLAQWMGHAKTSDLEIVFEQWRKSVVLRQWLRDRVNPESMTLYHGTRWETREPLPVVGTIVHRPWPIVQWTDRLGLARWFAGIDKSGGPLAGPPGGTTWPKWIGGVVEEAHASDGQIVVATDALVDLLAAHKLELEAIGASQDTLGMFGGEKWEGEVLTTSAVDGRVIEAQVFA